MIIQNKINHKTGIEARIHEERYPFGYANVELHYFVLECVEHGEMKECDTLREAHQLLRHPKEWCPKCADGNC